MAINVKDKLVTVESLGIAYSTEQGARQEADQALSTRIDNIVAPEGDPSLTEVSDARVSGQTTYNTLKARLDADKASIGTEMDEIKADLGDLQTGYIELESGTYVDGNGTQKYATLTRIRNARPVPTKGLKSITIPNGYSAWIFRLDVDLTLINAFGYWIGGEINIETVTTSATKFINFAIRNDLTPSGDVSGQVSTVQSALSCIYTNEDLSTSLSKLLMAADKTDFVQDANIYVKFDTGENMASNSWTARKIVNNGFGKIKAKLVSANAANAAIIAFYSDDTTLNSTTYMGTYSVKAINGTHEYIAEVPDGCKAIRVCTREMTFDNAVVTIYTKKTINDLSKDIDNIEGRIDDIEENIDSIEGSPPTDAQVSNAVSSWLAAHPDVTTTVQANSITEDKLSSNLKPYVLNCYTTPEMFGAVGDGSTDDSISIQAAIDYVNNQGGGIVQFGNKTYICQNILPKNNVTLRGTGSSVLKLPTTPSSHLIYYYGDTVINNFNLDNMQFDGGTQTTYDLIHIEKQSSSISYIWDKSVVNQCLFSNARVGISCSIPGNVKIINTVCQYNDIGIQQKNEHFHFINSMLWGNRIGADIYKANHFTWVNVTFAHNSEYGIYADASFESCLCACSFIDTGICVYGSVYSYRFIGCRMIESTGGIYGAHHRNIIDGCYFSSMTGAAIDFNVSGGYANIVSNCEFVGNNKGVSLVSDDHLIHANLFRQTKQTAITIQGSTSLGVQISNNVIIDASTEGDALYPAVKITVPYFASALISNNSIRNTGTGKASYAIDMDATFTNLVDTMVIGNIARNMKTSGYRIPNDVTKANNIGTVAS